MELKILNFKLDPFLIVESEEQINRFMKHHVISHTNTIEHNGSVYVFIYYEE